MARLSFYSFALYTFVFIVFVESYTTNKGRYRGCFEFDEKNSLLIDHKETLEKTLKPEDCVELCAKKNFPFAGLQQNDCRCGYHVPTNLARRSDAECDVPCAGDKNKKCGGSAMVSVFETGTDLKEFIPSRQYLGCFLDNVEEFRMLKGSASRFTDNSPEKCHKHCYATGFRFFGLTYIQECWCGDTAPAPERIRSESECDTRCNGDNRQFCGGGWRLGVYTTGITDIPETGRFVGCYKNAQNSEAKVEYQIEFPKSNTNRRCLNICNERGFKYSGVQNKSICSCLNQVPPKFFIDDDYKCAKDACPGDTVEKCGTKDRIRIFRTRIGDDNLDTEPRSLGCYEDQENYRALDGSMITIEGKLTPVLCIDICKNRGYAFAGLEAGNECFCGHSYPTKYIRADDNDCKIPCNGNLNSHCGGLHRVAAYSTGLPRSEARVNYWYLGCYKDDDKDNRMLRGQSNQFEDNSPNVCHKHCLRLGYKYFGLTWIKECFCGDEDPWADLLLDESECSKECGGDSNKKCGGGWRLSVYRTGIYDYAENTTNYLGCHKNDGTLLTNRKIELSWSNLPYRCTNICDQLGYAYAGVERGIECRCGTHLPKLTAEENSKCNHNCPGFSGQTCGGTNYMKILKTTISERESLILNPDPNVKKGNCQPTDTTKNGQAVCKNDSLLNEEFTVLNSSTWSHTIKMASSPDYEFVIYSNSEEVIFIKNGILHIKPKLETYEFIQSDLTLPNCTGNLESTECKRKVTAYNILPPVSSAQITTKDSFAFRFGRLEMRAKLPSGDWIVPEIWLTPRGSTYGPSYQSGQIRIAFARGNKELVCGNEKLGNRYLQAGVFVGPPNGVKRVIFTKEMPENWLSKFHDFALVWTTDNISFYVDGELICSVLKNQADTIRTVAKVPVNAEYLWKDGSKLAPFDKEFYITLGVSVGGINDFPDTCVSNGVKKPWSNTSPKAMLNFYEKRSQWKPSWNGDSVLQVDHIKINAL